MKNRLWRVLPLAAAAAVPLMLLGCGGGADPPPARGFGAVPVQAVAVRVGPLSAESSTAGTVVPVLQSQVASRVAGVVERLVRSSGEWVKKGEAVVQLEDTPFRLAVGNAEAALQSARIALGIGQDAVSQSNPRLQLQVQAAQSALAAAQKSYDAQKALFQMGGTSASALDGAESQLQRAQADLQAAQSALEQNQKSASQSLAQLELAVEQAGNQLEAARLDLRNAAVRAPFDGQVAAVNVSLGEFVSQNTPVFLLVSAARQVGFAVPPTDAASLPAGAAVQFSYGGRKLPLRVSRAPSAPLDGLVPMVAAVPDSSLLPFGAVGSVSYSLSLARGALVPVAALAMSENRSVVYSILNGQVAVQEVTVLGQTEATVAVAGLREGMQVILNPPPGLLPGEAVQAAGAAPAAGGQRIAPGPAAGAAGVAGGRP